MDECGEQGQDLMAYLMPIADDDSGAEESEEADDTPEGETDAEMEEERAALDSQNAGAPEVGLGDAGESVEAGVAAEEATEEQSGVRCPESELLPSVVTPHARKVLASSDIFTPESECGASPGA